MGEPVPEGTFRHLLDFLAQNEDNTGGRLKTREWKTRHHQKCRGGKRGSGKRGTIISDFYSLNNNLKIPK